MTDKQLAILLEQMANQLDSMADTIAEVIYDGAQEMVPVWVGEGEKPDFALTFGPNWDQQPKGEYIAVTIVTDYAELLRNQVKNLRDTTK